jgi:hypothetical protein
MTYCFSLFDFVTKNRGFKCDLIIRIKHEADENTLKFDFGGWYFCEKRLKMMIIRCILSTERCILRPERRIIRAERCIIMTATCILRTKRCILRGVTCIIRAERCIIRTVTCILRGVRGIIGAVRRRIIEIWGVFGSREWDFGIERMGIWSL